jgi:hypothetical protein
VVDDDKTMSIRVKMLMARKQQILDAIAAYRPELYAIDAELGRDEKSTDETRSSRSDF